MIGEERMDFSLYEEQLNKRMLSYGILCLIVAGVCAFFVLWNYHMSTGKKADNPGILETQLINCIIYILGIGGIIGSMVLGATTIWECSYDIKNEAYIVWEGDITVYRDGPSKSRWYIPDEDGIKLEGDELDEGKYTGKITYGEKTKVVLDYSISGNKGQEESPN